MLPFSNWLSPFKLFVCTNRKGKSFQVYKLIQISISNIKAKYKIKKGMRFPIERTVDSFDTIFESKTIEASRRNWKVHYQTLNKL